MFCNKCGEELSEGSLFCNKCGYDLRGIVDVDSRNKIQSLKKTRKIRQLFIKFSNNISSNIVVVIVSVIIFSVSIGGMRKVYKDICLKLDLIPIEKNIVNLTRQIYGSATIEESNFHQNYVALYLNIGKAILLSMVIIISVLLITYYVKKLIQLLKKRAIEQKAGL